MSKLTDLLANKAAATEILSETINAALIVPTINTTGAAPMPANTNPLQAGLNRISKSPAPIKKSPPFNTTTQKEITVHELLSHNLELSVDVEGRHANGVSNLADFDMETLRGQYDNNLHTISTALQIGQVGESLYKCLTFIDKNLNELEKEKMILPEDMGLLVQALQQSHGVVIQKKTENKAKRASTTKEDTALASKLSALGF